MRYQIPNLLGILYLTSQQRARPSARWYLFLGGVWRNKIFVSLGHFSCCTPFNRWLNGKMTVATQIFYFIKLGQGLGLYTIAPLLLNAPSFSFLTTPSYLSYISISVCYSLPCPLRTPYRAEQPVEAAAVADSNSS